MGSSRYITGRIQQVALDRALRMKRSRRNGRNRERRVVVAVLLTLAILAALLAFRWFFAEEEIVYPDPVCEWCGEVMDEKYVPCRMFHGEE